MYQQGERETPNKIKINYTRGNSVSEKAIPLPNTIQRLIISMAFIGAYFCAREYLGILEDLVYINKLLYLLLFLYTKM